MFVDKFIFCMISSFIILNNLPVTFSLKNKDVPCQQLGFCRCLFPTGRGINLTPVNNFFSVQVSATAQTAIMLHLCENIEYGRTNKYYYNQCKNVSMCFLDASKNESLTLGKVEDMTFISQSEHQLEPFSLLYKTEQNSTKIVLKCDPNAEESSLTYQTINGDATYNLELVSKHACVRQFSPDEGPSGGMSTGSVLVIMLLVFALVYLVGGMLTLRFLRGARGREMIPNVDFWMNLPYLVRDGIVFTLYGCRFPASYDTI